MPEFIELFAKGILNCWEALEETIELSDRGETKWCGSDLKEWFESREKGLELTFASVNRKYPKGSERHDLHLEFKSGQKVFVEGKGAWKSCWYTRGNKSKFDSYLFGPSVGEQGKSTKSAFWDLRKLATNTPDDTTHVALVIMGSAQPVHSIDVDLDRFEGLARIDSGPWRGFRRSWENRHTAGFLYDCRVWISPYREMRNWWDRHDTSFGEIPVPE